MSLWRQRCPCLQAEEEEVRVLDYRHCSLDNMPSEVFHYERTLEELYLDANQIRDLPRELFYCHGIRKLCVSDNELTKIPPAIASLNNLEHLDFSKNGIVNLPDNIKCCKYLSTVEASVNPLGKIPEGFTQLLNLAELYLNDTFLDYLPGSFGRLTKLRVLEVRENHLNTLPKSMSRLTCLERLDIGNNDFTELPDIIGSLTGLLELWCDCNDIRYIPKEIGQLRQLMFLDASKNRIEWIAKEIDGCESLADLYLSTNLLQQLPESIGRLCNLTTLRVDDNRLTSLPFTIGGLGSLSELNISANDLEEIPAGIGYLRHLRTLYADENFLYDIPPELGSCTGITVLSLRSNNLMYIPDEIGRIPRLRVLNLSDNKIRSLPYSLTRLKELQALWLSENQTKPMTKLQPEVDPDTGQRMLTCYLLPQMPNDDRDDMYSDAGSFHPSLWEEERKQRQRIHFDFDGNIEEQCKLERTPTPYPKEMKQRLQHMRNLALKQLNVANGDVRGEKASQSQAGAKGDGVSKSPVTNLLPSTIPPPPVSPKPPTSPVLHESHLLLKADKERKQKDKARIASRRSSQESLNSNVMPMKDGPSHKGQMKTENRDTTWSTQAKTPVEEEGGFLSRSMQRCAVSGSASDVAQAPKPPSTLDLNANMSQDFSKPGSYSDFLKGLSSGASSGQGIPYRPPVPDYRSPQSIATFYARSGYESDIGYRSDGYRSDQEALRHRKYHMARVRADGYSSDMDARRRPSGRREAGYASDMEVYARRSAKYRPVSAAPNYSSIPENHLSSNQPQSHKNALPPNYSNAPFTKRTMLRNDELYEQYSGSSGMSPHPKLPVKSRGDSSNPVKRTSSVNSQGSHSKLWPGSMTPETGSVRSVNTSFQGRPTGAANTGQNESGMHTPVNTSMQQAGPGNSDEEMYKAQLYQASVKLQKTPSEKRKTSPQKAMVVDLAQDNGGVGEDNLLLNPPPYQPAPPYTPQTPTRSQTDIPASSRTPRPDIPPSPRTPRGQARPNTLPLLATASPHQSKNDLSQSYISPGTPRDSYISPGTPRDASLHIHTGAAVASPRVNSPRVNSPRVNSPRKAQPGINAPMHADMDSPLRLTQYDKDVAMFKQAEPASHVSSSTDSGYGHTHTFDRLTGVEGRLSDEMSTREHSPASPQGSVGYRGGGRGSTDASSTPASSSFSHSPASAYDTLSPHMPQPNVFHVCVTKNPGLGFSIAGGVGSPGNPYQPDDMGIFITKVQPDGPATSILFPGDKILEVNGIDFRNCEHSLAVNTLRTCSQTTTLLIERR